MLVQLIIMNFYNEYANKNNIWQYDNVEQHFFLNQKCFFGGQRLFHYSIPSALNHTAEKVKRSQSYSNLKISECILLLYTTVVVYKGQAIFIYIYRYKGPVDRAKNKTSFKLYHKLISVARLWYGYWLNIYINNYHWNKKKK